MFYCLSNVNKKLNGQRGKHHFKIVVYVKASIEREEKKNRDNNVSHLNFFFIQAEIMRLLSPNTLDVTQDTRVSRKSRTHLTTCDHGTSFFTREKRQLKHAPKSRAK
jgi:hypothetical protein